jgi:hypothetical protein
MKLHYIFFGIISKGESIINEIALYFFWYYIERGKYYQLNCIIFCLVLYRKGKVLSIKLHYIFFGIISKGESIIH